MYTDYLLQMRGLSGTQLLALQAELQAQQTIFSAQNMGGKGMTRDLRLLNDQLTAIQYVINSRNPQPILPPATPNIGVGVTNFGRLVE
jgi:hypothetical protein